MKRYESADIHFQLRLIYETERASVHTFNKKWHGRSSSSEYRRYVVPQVNAFSYLSFARRLRWLVNLVQLQHCMNVRQNNVRSKTLMAIGKRPARLGASSV